jgi:hypothetical protein
MRSKLGRGPWCAIACLLVAVPSQSAAQATVAGFTPASFRVNEAGAATYIVPIQVPPGIAGMEPKLALAYNSQAGNGLVGAGWSLAGLSGVARCGRSIVQDGANAGVSYNANDRYCLDGQRLVLISGTYGADSAEYRTERESFTRIISYGSAGSGPAYFRAWTKSGQVIEYGNTADSRIEAQGKSDVRVYAVNKISDTKGNYLTFSYTEDNANGDYSPSRIDYTGNAATGVAPFASVQFAYQGRTDITPIYVGGSVIKTQNRLTDVKTYVGTAMIRDYQLAYTQTNSTAASRLTSLKECQGDGLTCLAPTNLTWQTSNGATGIAGPVNWGIASAQTSPLFGDVNGDGFMDVIYVSGGAIVVQFSNGSGFGGPVAVGSADSWIDDNGFSNPDPIAVADVNGDGRADVITVGDPNNSGNYGNVRLSTGNSLAGPVNWGISSAQTPPLFGDINGDGFADVVYVSGASIVVQFSNGSGFGGPVAVGSADSWIDINGFGNTCPIAVADVNGDGRADVITVSDPGNNGNYGNVRLSTGNSLAGPANWGISSAQTSPQFGDVNGDGFVDVVFVYGGSIVVQFSNGSGFGGAAAVGSADSWIDDNGFSNPDPIAIADVNGDGHSDVITVSDPNNSGNYGNVRAGLAATPDLVASFVNSLGASTSVTYKPLTDGTVYSADTGSAWPVRDLRIQGPLYVVASSSQTNGVGGNYVMNYFYTGAKAHVQGGGFLGFRLLAATDAQTGIKATTTFKQDYPFQGLPASVVKAQSSGAVLNQVTNTWTETLFPNATGKYHRCDLTQAVESSNDLNGAALPTVTTTTGYDTYGNASSIVVGTGDGFSKTSTNTFTNDTTNWFLGRLVRSQVTSTTP